MTTIAFAGGGTGGHIVPNLAIFERLQQIEPQLKSVWLVSERAIDKAVLAPEGHIRNVYPISAQPLAMHPVRLTKFVSALVWKARLQAKQVLRSQNVSALVVTGGFVSAPAVWAARQLKIPVAIVHLDAVPGKANRLMAPWATQGFSCYPDAHPQAQHVGPVLRQSMNQRAEVTEVKKRLGLNTQKPVLLITGGSQGGGTVNDAVLTWAKNSATELLQTWQILHVTGKQADADAIAKQWQNLGIEHRVEPFLPGLADAWAAASFSICRAGAGSVLESWIAGCPCLFMPYPWHKDQHQKKNIVPLQALSTDALSAALLIEDVKNADDNARALTDVLNPVMASQQQLTQMHELLVRNPPSDGAKAVAQWLIDQL